MNDELLQLLGLIYKAKKLVLGEEILNNLKKVKVMIIADDISEKSRLRYEKKANSYQIPIINGFDSKQLSEALGKNNVKTIGIIDEGFAKTALNKIK